MDASSAFQDSLPVSSDQLLSMLDESGFAVERIDHIPLRTVAIQNRCGTGFIS